MPQVLLDIPSYPVVWLQLCMNSRFADRLSATFRRSHVPEGPALLIRIAGMWSPRMTDDELLEATAGWWRIGPRPAKAQYAFAVNRGVIRPVYRIESWRVRRKETATGSTTRASGLVGASQARSRRRWPTYRNTSVRHMFKRGEASPTKYVNC